MIVEAEFHAVLWFPAAEAFAEEQKGNGPAKIRWRHPSSAVICEMHANFYQSVRACMKLDSKWQHLKYYYKMTAENVFTRVHEI